MFIDANGGIGGLTAKLRERLRTATLDPEAPRVPAHGSALVYCQRLSLAGPAAPSYFPMKRHCYLLLLLFFNLAAPAQTHPPAPGTWHAGLGVGNGLEAHGGYRANHWLAFGRLRGKWWGPEQEPKGHLFGDDINTHSQQSEVALLLGFPLPVGRSYFYGATGVAYVSGRQLGEYRYSLRKSGLLSADATHYYAYRDYQAFGLPLEVGWQSPPLRSEAVRLGLAAQANLNPQHSVYCFLATISVVVFPQHRADL